MSVVRFFILIYSSEINMGWARLGSPALGTTVLVSAGLGCAGLDSTGIDLSGQCLAGLGWGRFEQIQLKLSWLGWPC